MCASHDRPQAPCSCTGQGAIKPNGKRTKGNKQIFLRFILKEWPKALRKHYLMVEAVRGWGSSDLPRSMQMGHYPAWAASVWKTPALISLTPEH